MSGFIERHLVTLVLTSVIVVIIAFAVMVTVFGKRESTRRAACEAHGGVYKTDGRFRLCLKPGAIVEVPE